MARGFLVRKRTVYLPTWRGWLLLLLTAIALAAFAIRNIHAFLAVTAPVPANVLVLDGWMSDASLEEAIDIFREGDYDLLCTTGGPLTRGTLFAPYPTYAELAAGSLQKLGFDADLILTVPSPAVARNRTFASAMAVRKRLEEKRIAVAGLNLITTGPHARRSRLVYRKVFGPETPVGVIALASPSYDPDRWWRSSAGLKAVVSETLSWLFEWFDDAGRDAP